MANLSNTQYFKVKTEPEVQVKQVLDVVYTAMEEKGYNPVNQIVGYIMSGDPTYITSYKGARSMIMKVERDELVEELLKEYIKNKLGDSKKIAFIDVGWLGSGPIGLKYLIEEEFNLDCEVYCWQAAARPPQNTDILCTRTTKNAILKTKNSENVPSLQIVNFGYNNHRSKL